MTRRPAVTIVKPPITWILVADGRQAQIYRRQYVDELIPLERRFRRSQFEEVATNEPVPVPGMKWKAESPAQYEVGRNKIGMVFESANSARSMSEPHINVREEIRNHFAKTIAGHLNRAQAQKAFDRLVLIAPAKMLGEIKKQLDERVLKQVVAEMPKDLTHFDVEALADHLEHIT
jgi:protein required for attachment to host cells